MASASVTAQTLDTNLSPKEQKAKAAAELKAKKAKDAEELKEFKAKQKAELEQFIAAQKNPELAKFKLEAPVLKNDADTTAYYFGTLQSRGLMNYLQNEMKIDTSLYLSQFCQGMYDKVTADTVNKKAHAYDVGYSLGSRITQLVESLSKDYYSSTPDSALSGETLVKGLLGAILGQNKTPQDVAEETFEAKMESRKTYNLEKKFGPNRKAGEEFLAANASKPGVVVLPSGVQYKIITQGTGEKPKASSKVNVHYEGKLIDGKVFDSSYKREKPNTFGVTQVIDGWTEILLLMPVGSKWEVWIPYNHAYGDRDMGEIPPFSALHFTVELLGLAE